MKIDFASSRQSTLGVEWELALVDGQTGELASVANEVLRGRRRQTPRTQRGRRTPAHQAGTAAEHGGTRHRHLRDRRGSQGRPQPVPRRRPRNHRPHGRGGLLRRQPPLQPAPAAAGHGQGPLRQADRPHPVVGPADGHLRRPRPRGPRPPGQGPPGAGRPGQLLPALPGALRVQPVLGRRRHRLRLPAGPDVPAAAHRRPAVPVPRPGRNTSPTSRTCSPPA